MQGEGRWVKEDAKQRIQGHFAEELGPVLEAQNYSGTW